MREAPLISVLMPVYNCALYLRKAIDSVLAQTYSNFELLLINDGSTDNSKDIILSYNDPRIRYIENEHNLKLIATLNKGIDLAKGEYISRMDSDDVIPPNRFETQIRYLLKHPHVDLCSVWAYITDEKGKKIGKLKGIDTSGLINCSLFFTNPINHPGIMCKTHVLKENKFKTFLHAEDMELWITLRDKNYVMVNIPKYLYSYRWYGNNVSNSNAEFQLEQKKKLLKNQLETFFDRIIDEGEMNLHHLSYELFRWGNKKDGAIDQVTLCKEKEWLERISQQNLRNKMFPQSDLDALLCSRWLVCCLFTHKYMDFFRIKLPWNRAGVFFKIIKLLIYK